MTTERYDACPPPDVPTSAGWDCCGGFTASPRDQRIMDAIVQAEAALDMPEGAEKQAALAQVKETWKEFK